MTPPKTAEERAEKLVREIIEQVPFALEMRDMIATQITEACAEAVKAECLSQDLMWQTTMKDVREEVRLNTLEEAAGVAEIAKIDRHYLTTGAITKVIAEAIRMLKDRP